MAFTRESICQLLLSSGFAPVHCYEDGPVAHGVVTNRALAPMEGNQGRAPSLAGDREGRLGQRGHIFAESLRHRRQNESRHAFGLQ
jgi:hypothetical protein